MKYDKLSFHLSPYAEEYADVLAALLAEAGCETFSPTPDGLEAYAQRALLDEERVRQCAEAFVVPGVQVSYEREEAPDEDWNAVWEEEGFKPVAIGERVVVHDVKHTDVPPAQYDILITPRQAFGTGSHQTTRLLLSHLAQTPLAGRRVVDAGTGTGVLAILCAMRGASHVLAYDIDEWSVDNARDNLLLNGLHADVVEVRLGDASVLDGAAPADLLIANINRNTLLADLPRFRHALAPGGQLLMSGFYTSDEAVLAQAAEALGLRLAMQQSEDEWAMLLFEADAASGMDV